MPFARLIKWMFITVLTVTFFLLIISVTEMVIAKTNNDQAKYIAENKCIAKYIALQVQRKHIYRNDGSCYVRIDNEKSN